MPRCTLRRAAGEAPVDVLAECGLLRRARDLAPCWAAASTADGADGAVAALCCFGRTALEVVSHDIFDALHSARVLVLPDPGSSYVLEGSGAGRWTIWHPCATELGWAGTGQLGRELPRSCE